VTVGHNANRVRSTETVFDIQTVNIVSHALPMDKMSYLGPLFSDETVADRNGIRIQFSDFAGVALIPPQCVVNCAFKVMRANRRETVFAQNHFDNLLSTLSGTNTLPQRLRRA
jgi:hypothetical protein